MTAIRIELGLQLLSCMSAVLSLHGMGCPQYLLLETFVNFCFLLAGELGYSVLNCFCSLSTGIRKITSALPVLFF